MRLGDLRSRKLCVAVAQNGAERHGGKTNRWEGKGGREAEQQEKSEIKM